MHDRTRPPLHERLSRPRRASALARMARPVLMAAVACALLAGIAGGLLRTGVVVPGTAGSAWIGEALQWHAALMICGFLGTVIGIERAVAVGLPTAFLAPVASGAGAVALLTGHGAAGQILFMLAGLVFVAVNGVVVRRQRAPHTVLLLVAALAWLAGSVALARGDASSAPTAWWFAFLVLTIAAERLEMTRLMRRHPAATAAFHAIVALLLVGAAGTTVAPAAGGVVYGAALALLAGWLLRYDIARRTVHSHGLSRYMAVCLLAGYGWLLVAGAAWVAMALGQPVRDIALHALGLGFVVSMVMGHAPVILPAVARVKMQFGPFFYLPLGVLHASLLLRLGAGHIVIGLLAWGAVGNAAAIALFAATAVGGIVVWRVRHGAGRAGARAPGGGNRPSQES